MISRTDYLESKRLESSDYAVRRRIDRKFRHELLYGCFSYERLKDGIILDSGKRLRAESFEVKRQGRADVGQSFLVAVTLPHYAPSHQTKRIGHVAIGMLLHHNL